MGIQTVCVYCASSRLCDPAYLDAAEALGKELAHHGATIVYGGGGVGAMGRLADGALGEGGRVVGVIPRFMNELEWAHKGLSELRVATDIHQRKRMMIEEADGVVALPGGCGTLEELFEAITWKRLGLYLNPIVMVNVRGFFNPCVELLEKCVREQFMDLRHRSMWTVVETPQEVVPAIRNAPKWSVDNRKFAVLK